MTFLLRFAACLIAIAVPALADRLPRLAAENLDKQEIVLPDAARGRYALLLVGFSQSSKNMMKPWTDRWAKDFGSDAHAVLYQAAVLEDVPRLFRGVVVSGIRKGVPAGEAARFLTVFHDKQRWQDAFGYGAPDDSYLILLDPEDQVRWKFHGAFQPSEFARLKALLSP